MQNLYTISQTGPSLLFSQTNITTNKSAPRRAVATPAPTANTKAPRACCAARTKRERASLSTARVVGSWLVHRRAHVTSRRALRCARRAYPTLARPRLPLPAPHAHPVQARDVSGGSCGCDVSSAPFGHIIFNTRQFGCAVGMRCYICTVPYAEPCTQTRSREGGI